MSICNGCIHDDVCGLEDNHEEGIVSCADRIPKDRFEKISDVISKRAVLEMAINVPIAKVVPEDKVIYRKIVFADDIETLSPIALQKMGHCKDCRYFEYDYVVNVDGIPLILAHEFCKKWGDGCKTREDGYCFLFEPKERSDHEST